MVDLDILRSVDIENVVREALDSYFTIYCRPLPENFTTPSILVSSVGGTDLNKIDTFDVVLDSRAETEEEASELLRNAIGALKEIGKRQTTPIRNVSINSMGSWGNDPVRPDLAMYSARLRVVTHQELTTI